jgi:deoxyribonuclease-4
MSTSGGISKAVARGTEIGCEAIQIFGSSPQAWAFKPIPGTEIEAFRQEAAEAGIGPVFLHAIYLINLGTPDQDKLDKGIESLVNYMRLAADLDAAGVIVHPGSHGGRGYDAVFGQTVDAIKRVLDESPEGPRLTLENMAGMGQHIGARFDELGRILKEVDSPRLGICLDTQHSFAAGHDLTTEDGIKAMISEFDQVIGLENLVAVHANDSKRPCGAGVDRHDNIGDGFIGVAGFETIMADPAFHQVPFFLEVPGFEGKGPDQRNIQILKDIRHRLDVEP